MSFILVVFFPTFISESINRSFSSTFGSPPFSRTQLIFYFLHVLAIRSPLPSGASLLPSWGPSRGNLFREKCHSTWSQWWLPSVITIPHICLCLYNSWRKGSRYKFTYSSSYYMSSTILNEAHQIIWGLSDPFVTLELLPRRIFTSCEPM